MIRVGLERLQSAKYFINIKGAGVRKKEHMAPGWILKQRIHRSVLGKILFHIESRVADAKVSHASGGDGVPRFPWMLQDDKWHRGFKWTNVGAIASGGCFATLSANRSK
jgi:hypothetical protein